MFILSISSFAAGVLAVAGLAIGIIVGNTVLPTRKRNVTKRISGIEPCNYDDRYLSTTDAMQMIHGYSKSDIKIKPEQETKSVFMSTEYLNCYINDMKRECNQRNLGLDVSGIRVFLGRHVSKETLPDSDHVVGQATLVIYPTFAEGMQQISFDPKLSSRGKIVKVSDLLSQSLGDKSETEKSNILQSGQFGSSASDRGQTSPPRHP